MKKCRKLFLALLFALSSLFIVLPLHAEPVYVQDDYGMLDPYEISDLEALAATYSEQYECGIYVRIKDDYENGYSFVEEYSEYLFKSEDMGLGEEKNGVMLLIVMSDRSYDIVAYGDTANRAFTDYCKEQIADDFLSDLSNGRYASAFESFIKSSADALEAEKTGTPIDVPGYDPNSSYDSNDNIDYLVVLTPAAIVSLIIVWVMASKHKTKGRKFEASNYIQASDSKITHPRDIFIREETHRRRIRTHDDSGSSHSSGGGGGTSVNSGGFSHSSGHF